MVLPSSGSSISLDQIHVELGEDSGGTVALGDDDVRALASDTSGAIGMNQFFGLAATGAWVFRATIDNVAAAAPYGSQYTQAIAASKVGDGVYALFTKYNNQGMNDGESYNNANPEFNVMKINLDGSIAWNKRIDGPEIQLWNCAITVAATSGADELFIWHRYIAAGSGFTGSGNLRRITKLNSSGVEQAERIYNFETQQKEYLTGPNGSYSYDDGTNIWWGISTYDKLYNQGTAGMQGAGWTKIRKSDAHFQSEFGAADNRGSAYGQGPVYVDGSGNVSFFASDPQLVQDKLHNALKYDSGGYRIFERYYRFNSTGGQSQYALQFKDGVMDGAHALLGLAVTAAANDGETGSAGQGPYPGIIKINTANGNGVWLTYSYTNAAHDFTFNSVAVDSNSNVYATGKGVLDGDSKQGIIVAKFNSSGAKQWNFVISYNDDSQHMDAYGTVIDDNDNLFVNFVDFSDGGQSIMQIPADDLGSLPIAAGTYGIYKITNTNFAFNVQTTITGANADGPTGNGPSVRYKGFPTRSDSASNNETTQSESGGASTLVDLV